MIPAIGFTVSEPLCGDTFSSIVGEFSTPGKCACTHNSSKKSCCDNTEICFKLRDNQQQTEEFSAKFSKPATALKKNNSFTFSIPIVFTHSTPLDKFEPIELYTPPLYLMNRVLRI